MPILPERSAGLFVRDDDEGLFSRDLNGQLVRLDAPTQDDYARSKSRCRSMANRSPCRWPSR